MERNHSKSHHIFSHQDTLHAIDVEEMRCSTGEVKLTGRVEGHPATGGAGADRQTPSNELGFRSEKRHAELPAKEKDETVPVVSICLALTQSCNLKCVYCYGEGRKDDGTNDMAELTACRTVDWLIEQSGNQKKVHINFFGGEPLLKFSLIKAIVNYARQRTATAGKDVDFHLTTNGTLLDDERIAFIKENQIHTQVSFDGTKALQDSQRPLTNGEGSYDCLVPKIKKLLAVLPETAGHAVITGGTDPSLVIEALQEIGFADISITPASRSLFTAKPGPTRTARDTAKLLSALEQDAENWIRLTRKRDQQALQDLSHRSVLAHGIQALLHNSKRRHACGAGRGLVGISPAGDIYLCHRFIGKDEYKLGNVFANDLDRDKYQPSPVKYNRACASCFAKYYCGGGCKHDHVGTCGSIAQPAADYCRIRCRELELAAVVICSIAPAGTEFLLGEGIFPPKPCPFDF